MSKFVEKLVHEPTRLDANFSGGWNSDFKTEEYANFAPASAPMKRQTPDKMTKSMTENAACEDWVLHAQAYVPRQETMNLVSGNRGTVCGSIFADLIMPYAKPAANASLSVS